MHATMRILPVILFLVAGCVAASRTTESGERANVIHIETTDDPDTAYRKVAQILQSQGYSLDRTDAVLHSLTTQPKDIRGGTLRFQVNVLDGSPNRVQLTAHLYTPGLGESRAEAMGMEGSPMKRAWDEMEQIAQQYQGGALKYERIR